jgi:hypothetical protein
MSGVDACAMLGDWIGKTDTQDGSRNMNQGTNNGAKRRPTSLDQYQRSQAHEHNQGEHRFEGKHQSRKVGQNFA